MKKRITVIGGGPGGYVAAIRAAQLGADVCLIEKEKVGGTCLNRGCIPTKAILHSVELFQAIKKGAASGVLADNLRIDWPSVMRNKQSIVNRLVGGVDGLLKANGVTLYRGAARLLDAHTVEVTANGDSQHVQSDVIILAIGSEPVALPIPGAELPGVIDSTQALEFKQIPQSLLIIGGGVIGMEFAAMYNALGTVVTVVEMMPDVLPGIDGEMAAALKQELADTGTAFLTSARVTAIAEGEAGLQVEVQAAGAVRRIEAEYVLVAIGRRPVSQGSGLEALGIATERGKIITNEHFQTNVPGIYAIGDCNGKSMLAHAASAQGIAAVEHALGLPAAYHGNIVPACIYTTPELAAVGLTEEQAGQSGKAYKVGRFPLAGNGKAIIENGGKGFVKIIAGAKYGEIIGVHILGPRATDLIAEAALAIRLEATVEELISTIHAHPTVSEAVAEAALAIDDMAVHWPPRRR